MNKRIIKAIAVAAIVLMGIHSGNACTNYLITKGASVDGSTMISYAAYSHMLYGELFPTFFGLP